MTPKLTGVAVTSKRRPIRRTLVAVVVLLYALITIDAVANLSSTSPAFVKNGESFWTVTLKLNSVGQAVYLVAGIAASLSTILADSYIVCATSLVIIHVNITSFHP